MIHRRSRGALGLTILGGAALLAMLSAAPLSGQAICSAPHSSPTLAHSGSLRTLPAGAGWIQGAFFGQRATRFFDPEGTRSPFLADSEFDTRSLFLTGAVGVVEGLELWVQVPFHDLEVESAGGNSTGSGVGDIRMAARLSSDLVGLELPVSLRLGAKVPGSEFPVDATVLPLTEGQRDWEVSIESGGRLPNRTLYLLGWVGYRWREENTDAARHPGDEVFASLLVGGQTGPVHWGLTADGLWGRTPLAQGFRLPGDKRRLFQLLPTFGLDAGPGRLEFTGQVPIRGQNLPVGNGVSIGYRWTWGLDPDPITDLRDYFRS